MDPNATLTAVLDGDSDARRDLNGWLERGGFAPRVQSHPATDAWAAGDRYGAVVKVDTRYVHVRMDRSGRVRRFPFDLVTIVEGR
jgi:hypothetical protein